MKSKLFLIDANSVIYRAFFAIRNLSTSYGQPTGAILGFVNALNKILKSNQPDYLAICFDVSKDTFRKKEFSDYKINRPPMPDGLVSQFPIIKEIISSYKFSCLEKEGFEADDVIATIVEKFKNKELEIVIVSSDKDILQLVGNAVFVLNPYKEDEGLTYDEKAVSERFGVQPDRISDILSLMGDASDNIPGVRGIGEKTAIELVKQFGSVEDLIKNIEEIKQEKLRQTIQDNIAQITLSKRLAQLKKDVPVDFDLKDLKIRKADYNSLFKIFKQLEFKSLMKSLPIDDSPQEKTKCTKIKSKKDYEDLIKKVEKNKEFTFYINKVTADIIETRDFDLYIAINDYEVFGLGSFTKQALDLFSNDKIKKIAHDLKSTLVLLNNEQSDFRGNSFDTMLAGYLIDPGKSDYSILSLASDFLDIRLSESTAPPNKVVLVNRLAPILEKRLAKDKLGSLFFDLEMPLIKVLAWIETNGIGIDKDALERLSKDLTKTLNKLIEDIYKISGESLNINSPKQLAHVLFEKLKLPVIKKTKTGASTDEEVLNVLSQQHKLPKLILEYRQLTKIKSTYIDGMLPLINPKTKRIHTTLNQVATETGRLSSSEPNLQNLPIKTEIGREIRKAIICGSPEAQLLSADYSQIELRILAHLSGDEKLITAFKQDKDIHKTTASFIYNLKEDQISDEMRDTAKRINFGIVYGMSAFGLSHDLGIPQDEAVAFIDTYFQRYPKVKDYTASQIELAKKNGFVTTLLGRRRYIHGIDSKNNAIRGFAERQAINTPIQGSASDLIKLAMINIYKEIKEKAFKTLMVLQIHDELLFEVPKKELDQIIDLVRDKMQTVLKLVVPIRVDLKKGRNWLEMERV